MCTMQRAVYRGNCDSQSMVWEGTMTWSPEDRVRELARLVGIPLIEAEISEVANRFESLIGELDRLMPLDLAHIQPVTIFPEEE